MVSTFTLDQLAVFVAVVESGSLSEAARTLHRTQSAISKTIAGLERQLEIKLFQRTAKGTSLTEAGGALVRAAKETLAAGDRLSAEAIRLQNACSPIVSLALDALFPIEPLLRSVREIEDLHGRIPLIIRTETLTQLPRLVADGVCSAAICGPQGSRDHRFDRRFLMVTRMVPVCAPDHPLAELARQGAIAPLELKDHTHIYTTDRVVESEPFPSGQEKHWWKTTAVSTKTECLLHGIGWGFMPRHRVQSLLDAGRLVHLPVDGWPDSWPHEQYWITRRDIPVRPVLDRLLELLIAELGSSAEE